MKEKIPKEIALFGLGKMGKNMAERLIERGWKVFVFDKEREKRKELVKEGAIEIENLSQLKEKIKPKRVIWLMLPHQIVEEVIFGKGKKRGLISVLEKGDIIIDGGNSFFKETIKRYKKLEKLEIEFLDVGVSGGPEGARKGACLMIGGKRENFEKLKPLFKDLATRGGFEFFEGKGAGHFVKMVHNGIEYGMMQAIAEGFNLLKNSPFNLNLKKVAKVYNRKSVIQSRLIGWLERAFEKYGQELKEVTGRVKMTGEGEWTVKTAKELKLAVEVIEKSVEFRRRSQKAPSYIGKILSALREGFGGHSIKD